jgi:hypothetical protein
LKNATRHDPTAYADLQRMTLMDVQEYIEAWLRSTLAEQKQAKELKNRIRRHGKRR